jgi:signal transduction histidine kinase
MLFNIIKHAGVNRATLRLRQCAERLRLTISDRTGLRPDDAGEHLGFGLLTIRERRAARRA